MYLLVNNQKIRAKFITFAGGEEHVQLCMEDVEKAMDTCAISNKYSHCDNMVAYGYLKSSRDLMRYMNMVNAAQQIFMPTHLTLNIPYLPFGRQDRVCSPGQAFGLEMLVSMLVSLDPNKIITDDIHSGIAGDLFNYWEVEFTNCKQVDIFMQYYKAPHNREKFKDFVLVAPDKGAQRKTFLLTQELGVSYQQADKVRNPATGQITSTTVGCQDFEGKDVWVVDDILDGGKTFTELAKVLRERNCGKLGLFITHGIFSKGKEVLYEHFDYIGTAYDWTIPEIIEEF